MYVLADFKENNTRNESTVSGACNIFDISKWQNYDIFGCDQKFYTSYEKEISQIVLEYIA